MKKDVLALRAAANAGGGGSPGTGAGGKEGTIRKPSLGDITNSMSLNSSPRGGDTIGKSRSRSRERAPIPSSFVEPDPSSTTSFDALTSTPVRQTGKKSYGRELGASPTKISPKKARSRSRVRPKSTEEVPTPGTPAYSSLQDMLVASGFADVRVITPTTTIRRSSHHNRISSIDSSLPPTPTRTPPNTLTPKTSSNHLHQPKLRPKPSLLSIVSSMWRQKPEDEDNAAEAVGGSVDEPHSQEVDGVSDDDSDDTIMIGRKSRAAEWVEEVARESKSISPPITRILGALPPERGSSTEIQDPSHLKWRGNLSGVG
ncbi:hypothetical protein MNV49_007771 [Pseudohyphozyma bogoriensis]|nr:hypothetical protein MNV49_007771 [Pseudohyphozyma bogoriensis]